MNVIDVLKKHEKEIKDKFGVKRIGVSGSYVRGEEKEGSDIDVLVEFEEPTLHNFMGLIFYLEEFLAKKSIWLLQMPLVLICAQQ